MNNNGTFRLNGAAFALLSLLFCGTLATISGLGPDSIDLGTAGDFVILTKTGVSTTGDTKVTGDVGASPIAATGITGFGLVLDSTTTFSTSSLVVGEVYAADYTTPTPSKMTTAIGDMELAFVDAAGRNEPDHTELYAGDLTGAGLYSNVKPALTPGLYKWSGTVTFTDLIIFDGSSTDIWIMQIAQDLTVGPGATVVLEGGALAENIFWQVSGQTTIGAGSQVQGIILCKTHIFFYSGASLTGRALSQTAVTMSTTTIHA